MEGKAISELFINEQIRDREVRVIGVNGEQLGVMSAREAMALAEEAGVDLIKIVPTAKPPVCRIADYGKYRYEQARKEKEAKKKQKVIEIKEIRLSPNIDTNDLNTKISAARKFLTVTFRFHTNAENAPGQRVRIADGSAELSAQTAHNPYRPGAAVLSRNALTHCSGVLDIFIE